ncbi:hypothetical protein RRF57_003593 [Xylaria bambusicola]|uniref:Uncharacterized protein n=1 Tax=Xylaria bambusicola TaxID=326684 RepID=A0AAN7Z5J3_9PEZI
MRLVNSVETEMLRSEWENWLMDESSRCEQVGIALQEASSNVGGLKADSVKGQLAQKIVNDGFGSGTNKKLGKSDNLRQWYEEYCGSCRVDHDALIRHREDLSMAPL